MYNLFLVKLSTGKVLAGLLDDESDVDLASFKSPSEAMAYGMDLIKDNPSMYDGKDFKIVKAGRF